MSDLSTQKPVSSWSMVGKDPYSMPIEEIDLAHPGIWQKNEYLPFLKRLREEAPVHYCAKSATGPYWSVMKYRDIMEVDTSPDIYSSEPTISIVDSFEEFTLPSFIAMDPPKHDLQRATVSGVVAPPNLAKMFCIHFMMCFVTISPKWKKSSLKLRPALKRSSSAVWFR